MASTDVREDLSCSICLNIFKDPASLRCGHNFCRECIDHVMDTQEESGLYICPECREEFRERPVLYNARALRNIAEKLLFSQPDQEDTGIYCTYCVDSPEPAIKSCLQCESFLCGKHLRAHIRSPKHILFDPNNFPENRTCSIHKKILEYYCTNEKVCICVHCIVFGKHRLHRVEPLDEASKKKNEKLRKDLEMLTSNKEWAEKKVQSLTERRADVEIKAAGVTERVTAMFRDVRRELEELEKRVLGDISMQTEKISQSVSNLIQQLEIQKDELSRKMSHIEELCNISDSMIVLKDQNSDKEEICPTEQEATMDSMIPCEGGFHEDSIRDRLRELSDFIKYIPICIQKPEGLLLDEETAANDIQISMDLKTAKFSEVTLDYPISPKRFHLYQVQCRRSFSSGRHCWEVDTSKSTGWRVGLCYPSMDRRPFIGNEKNSWCLRRDDDEYNIVHEKTFVLFPHRPTSHKFRIYLDYEAGRISFYERSDPIRHLHTFTITFTEPLEFVICIWNGLMTITN
ncbi:E3 ubiquitin/ISG15 ligase TRIM25-like [Rana temporaria]|uniref:E3 ubiquitin/ISG15 ligase TRIM25-like n=1 Tax=Rana temporaria TaxID=8407 RepID=UPI001AAC466A|nr:E3 ubiquitin/ISG15 ligase TRIM25-like [Rana temporaria]